MRPGFGWLARPYRWMEYLSFGRALERCRSHYLQDATDCRSALLLGDGDGRYAARLLQAAGQARVFAVDSSQAMLTALRARCAKHSSATRTQTCCADLATGLPDEARVQRYDLVATHFFLDCLSEEEIEQLARQIVPVLATGGRWIVSEFHVPDSPLRLPARALICSLYVAFRVLTGLGTQRLPKYREVLARVGFVQQRRTLLLGGLLVAEVWAAPTQLGDTDGTAKMESA